MPSPTRPVVSSVSVLLLNSVAPVLLEMAVITVPSMSKTSTTSSTTLPPRTSSGDPRKMTTTTTTTATTAAADLLNSMSGNVSKEWLSPTELLNTTLTGTGGGRGQCIEWQDSQQALFQTANLCYLVAFLVPNHLRLCALLVRGMLCAGFLMCTFWAGMYVCAADIFAWNLTYLTVNAIHVAFLCWKYFPPRIRAELRDLYSKVFIPLKMDKQSFRDLMRDAHVVDLQPGDHYAIEDVSAADERLSILLKGRLKVTCEDTHLHNIFPNQFIDSPEWEACPTGCDELYQVTIVATEPSRYVCWSRRKLQQLLRGKPYLDAVIYNLVGKDITQKLYLLNEHLNPKFPNSRRGTRTQPGDICSEWHWKQQFQRSLSVDAVHTGTRGQVQSHTWSLHARRTSAHSNSLGSSSPARASRFSHLSDPGPGPNQGACNRGKDANCTMDTTTTTSGETTATTIASLSSTTTTAAAAAAAAAATPAGVKTEKSLCRWSTSTSSTTSTCMSTQEERCPRSTNANANTQRLHVAFETPV